MDVRQQGRKGCVLTCKEAMIPYYEKFGFQNWGVSDSALAGQIWYDMGLTLEEGELQEKIKRQRLENDFCFDIIGEKADERTYILSAGDESAMKAQAV